MGIEELENKIKELTEELNKLKEEKNKRWRATNNWDYYYITNAVDILKEYENHSEIDNSRYDTGNYFKTEEQAEETKKKILIYMQLKDLALRLNNGEKIDWENYNQCKWYIQIRNNKILNDDGCYENKEIGQIYCINSKFLEIAKEEIGEDNLKLLFKISKEDSERIKRNLEEN